MSRKHLRVLTFTTNLCNSDGDPVPGTGMEHNLLFNSSQISEEELEYLIENDAYYFDPRVVDIDTKTLNLLKDKKPERRPYIISVEGYKAFHGDMLIKPINRDSYVITDKDWLYKPEYECWYGNGQSFPASICEIIYEED